MVWQQRRETNSLGHQIDSLPGCVDGMKGQRGKERRGEDGWCRERTDRCVRREIDAIVVLVHLYQKPAVAVIERG